MRGFGITGVDFSLEVQMDKLAHKVGMDPMEFRILNAYRDGDMKAHRREAHNCALIECVQVAAEKAGWPIRDEYRRMNSLTGGGGERAVIPATATDEAGTHRRRPARRARRRPARRRCRSRRRRACRSPPPRSRGSLRRPGRAAAGAATAVRRACAPRAAQARRPAPQHGATRFSSVFGTRRR